MPAGGHELNDISPIYRIESRFVSYYILHQLLTSRTESDMLLVVLSAQKFPTLLYYLVLFLRSVQSYTSPS